MPTDLRAINNDIKANKKKGEGVKKGSGFGGKGFKFDEAEQKRLCDAKNRDKKLKLIEDGVEVSDDEKELEPEQDEEEFLEQAANLNTAHAQKVADYTAKTVEAESNKAFNDLVKKATGGLLLKDIVPTAPTAPGPNSGLLGQTAAAAQGMAGGGGACDKRRCSTCQGGGGGAWSRARLGHDHHRRHAGPPAPPAAARGRARLHGRAERRLETCRKLTARADQVVGFGQHPTAEAAMLAAQRAAAVRARSPKNYRYLER